MVKAKSDSSIVSSLASDICGSGACSRSRSLEAVGALPMWQETPTEIELTKAERGLGFSILDYQVNCSTYLCFIRFYFRVTLNWIRTSSCFIRRIGLVQLVKRPVASL